MPLVLLYTCVIIISHIYTIFFSKIFWFNKWSIAFYAPSVFAISTQTRKTLVIERDVYYNYIKY